VDFAEVLLICGRNRELVAEFDRLHKSNLSRRGTGLDLMIDDAAGRTDADVRAFAEFVREFIYDRVFPAASPTGV
jgi:hypothetical protein